MSDGPERGWTREVDVGETVRFGSCPCSECRPDVQVGTTEWFRFAVEVTGAAGLWFLSNASPELTVAVRDAEERSQYVLLPPGRAVVPVPFEIALVEAPGYRLIVFGPEPRWLPATHPSALFAERLDTLQPGTAYMAVLRALCRGEALAETLPSSAEIAARLEEEGLTLTRKAVDHHIDYLFRRLYPDWGPHRTPRGWKRTAVAAAVTGSEVLKAGLRRSVNRG